MKKIFISAVILTLLVSNALAFDLRIERKRIYLHAVDEPLQNILQRIEQQGIKVRIDPQVNPRITVRYEDRDLQEVIAEIVRPYDHVLVWEKISNEPSSFRLSEIQVFRTGQKEIIQDLNSRTFSLVKGIKDGALFVRDQLLLKVRSRINLNKLLAKIGGTITDRNEALGIYKVSLPVGSDIQAIVNSINSLTDIAQAAPDNAYLINNLYRTDLTLPSSGNSKLFQIDGKVPVAVLDSGLIPGIGSDDFVIASFDAVNPTNPISDNLGHGTQMALIASGQIAPFGAKKEDGSQVPIIAIRAMDDNGFTTDFTILKSIDYAMEKGAKVISLSWGSANDSGFLKEIMDYAASKGMIIVASAGNEPTGKPVYPAAYSSVIGVGAAYPDGKVWDKSNYGSFVSIYAPGFAAFTVGYKGDPGIYGGTSISAAFVANGIANYLSKYPESSIQQIKAALMAGTLMAGK